MAYIVKKKPWLGSLLVFFFGPFGFLYYSFKKTLIVYFLFFFIPGAVLYQPQNTISVETIRWLIQFFLAVYAYIDLKGRLEIFDKAFTYLVAVISTPILFLNLLGGIVGGVWILFLGEWRLVVLGIILSSIIPLLYSLTLLIQMPMFLFIDYLQKHGKKLLTMIFSFLNILFSHVIIVFYVILIADRSILFSEINSLNVVPFLLFGYAVATGPFTYMASKEGDDGAASFIAVFMAQLAYIIISVGYLSNSLPLAFAIVLISVFGSEIYLMSSISRMISEENI